MINSKNSEKEEKVEKNKPKGKGRLILFSILIGLLIIGGLTNTGEKENKEAPAEPVPTEKTTKGTIQEKEESEKDLSLSRERFDYYNKKCLEFQALQEKYEQTYRDEGVFDTEKIAEENFAESLEHADKYGSITREITSIFHGLPKFDFDMASGEQYLLPKAANYGSALIFMTPKEDGIEGIDYVLESKEILEKALDEVKNFNNF